MTDLVTRVAQSLHDKWCEQMREKGFYGSTDPIGGYTLHDKFHSGLIPWPDLPESRRQEYLATAKAVLPEIVGEVFDSCIIAVCESCYAGHSPNKNGLHILVRAGYRSERIRCTAQAIRALRDRHLEELKK